MEERSYRLNHKVLVMSNKKRVVLIAKILVSISLMVYLFSQMDTDAFVDRIFNLSPYFVLFAWAFYAGCQWISAYRWQMFLAVKSIHVRLSTLFSFYMVGMFLNNFLPGAVGGDAVKAYDLYRHTEDGNISIASVFLERFTGLIGLIVIAVIAAIFGMKDIESTVVMWAVWGTLLFLLAVVFMIWSGPGFKIINTLIKLLLPSFVEKKFSELYKAVHSYRSHKKVLMHSILISIVLQFLFALYYVLTAMALGIEIDLIYFLLFLPIITIVTMIPISFGGLGVREGLMVVLFAEVGVSSADIVSISLTVYFINTLLSLWGGAIFLTRSSPAKASEP